MKYWIGWVRALCLLPFVPSAAMAGDPPTFHREVSRILHRHCAGCHREGEVGPFPLLDYADARKRARLIAQVTADRLMPPWKPDSADEFADARVLAPQELATLAAWADSEAPAGDPADAPPRPAFPEGWQLGVPDLILRMPEPFEVPAEGRDIYMHFVFPLHLKSDAHLRGIEVRPGNRRVAHHAVGILDTSGTARRKDARHPGPGYPGLGPGFIPAGFTPGYAPGQTPRLFHQDVSITLRKGTDFVLQMHYHPVGKVERDQTEIGLYFAQTRPPRGMIAVGLASEEIDIPAGENSFRAIDSFTLPVDLEIRDVWAHMHTIGRKVRATARLPDGTERPLLRISDWDFNWQDVYVYRQPFRLPKGTVIETEWTWDNSADNPRNPFSPPQRIRQGEASTDEMSGLILGGAADNAIDEVSHWGAVVGHYAEITGKGILFRLRHTK